MTEPSPDDQSLTEGAELTEGQLLTPAEAMGVLIAGTGDITVAHSGRLYLGKPPEVAVFKWMCPWCTGPAAVFDPEVESCLHCHGTMVTNDVGGFESHELVRAPRPPGVMRRPCTDCALRPGSPEQESGVPITPAAPFFCHHGLPRYKNGYISPAYAGRLPLGAMVCAGWWALAHGEPLPAEEFHDPGGSDRTPDAPDGERVRALSPEGVCDPRAGLPYAHGTSEQS